MEQTAFGPYELRRLLGRGGMGEVYEAFDREQNRVVALKLLPRALIQDEGFVERFRRESFAAARLSDPHVIPIHRYGDIDGQLYLDMRLVRGRDLGQVLAEDGPLPAARAVSLVAQAAEALDAAHADNLVHRDVKPSNLLITGQDFVYLVDFGIAHVFGLSTSGAALTATGATIGTLDYMAPERFIGRKEVDARADVYSLACVLYECLTGRRPFPVEGLPALMHSHLETPPPRAGAVRPDVPPALDQVIAIGMAKDPAQRYPSTGELARAATQAVHGTVRAPGVPVTLPGVEPSDRHSGNERLWLTPSGTGPLAPPTYVPGTPMPVMPPTAFREPPPDEQPTIKRRRTLMWVAAAAVVVVVAVAGVLVWRLSTENSTADGRPAAGPVAAESSETPSGDRSAGSVAAASSAATATSSVPSSPVGSQVTPPPETVVVTSVERQTVTEVVPVTPVPPPRSAGVGDLGLSVPIANVGCSGQHLTLVKSATTPGAYEVEIASMLAAFPGSSYLRTDASCGALAQDLNGNPIYAVYYGPYSSSSAACAARPTPESYVKVLGAGVGPDESTVEC